MDESGAPSTRQTIESPGETCVDAIHEEQLIRDSSSGRKDNESERLSNDPRTDLDAVAREASFDVIAQGRFDVSLLKASFEGLQNANLKFNAELDAICQTGEVEFQEQKQLVCQTQRENETLRELIITERNSRTTQVVEFQETICAMKDEIEQLRQHVNNVPAICEDSLATTIAMATGELFRHQLGLSKDLRKCCMQLESATQEVNLKTRESERFTAYITLLEEANSKLEQRVEKIQQELCKEKDGHDGSYIDGSPTPMVWESMANEMLSFISILSSKLSVYKDSKGGNPTHSLILGGELWGRLRVVTHWIYLLRNYICDGLFKDFEYETFLSSDSRVLFLDQEERVSNCLDYYQKSTNEGSSNNAPASNAPRDRLDLFFYRYFRNQIRLLPSEVHQLIMAFKDDELIGISRNKIQKSGIPADKRRLLVSFIIAAKKVWDFHKLCLSFDPPATIFRVSPGDPFNADYMESIGKPDYYTAPTVGCMVYPGFRLRKSIIKCKVFLTMKI